MGGLRGGLVASLGVYENLLSGDSNLVGGQHLAFEYTAATDQPSTGDP